MASINEKLNYINETKSLIKDKLNDLGSEITNQTTFRNYADKIEDLYEEWPKTSDENAIISLNNTKKAKMNLQLKGNTNQLITTGANYILLRDLPNGATANSITQFGFPDTGMVVLNGKPSSTFNLLIANVTLPAGTYTLTGCPTGGSWNDSYGLLLVGNGTSYADYGNGKTFTLENETDFEVMMRVSSNYTFNNFIFYPMLNEGSTAKPFEPYSEMEAIPSPSSPQDIKIVTGNNKIKINNKNIYNGTCNRTISNITSVVDTQYFTLNGTSNADNKMYFKIQKLPAGTYTLCCKYISGSFSNTLSYPDHIVRVWKGDTWTAFGKTLNLNATNLTQGAITFTLNEETEISFGCYYRSTDIYNNMKYAYQIIIGNEPNYDFSPYQSQDFSINLGSLELCKIDNYQDYLYKENNNWYKKPMILKVANYNSETISTDYISTTGELSTGATVYYKNPNTNPAGIQITNTTLINQLNMIEQAYSYNNQTDIIQIENTSLPFIINATGLLKNSN